MDLAERMEALGRDLGAREAAHGDALEQARVKAAALHEEVKAALERFADAAVAAGAPALDIRVTDPRLDEKHIRSIEFDLRRGRHTGIVVVKARGEITLVGPFRQGKTEGPCRSFPIDAEGEVRAGLGEFLERFAEEAMSP